MRPFLLNLVGEMKNYYCHFCTSCIKKIQQSILNLHKFAHIQISCDCSLLLGVFNVEFNKAIMSKNLNI